MSNSTLTVVNVLIEDREDGGYRVSSRDLPGLILSGLDKTAVISAIAPAIKSLFELKGKFLVGVTMAKPISDILNGQNPQSVGVKVGHHEHRRCS